MVLYIHFPHAKIRNIKMGHRLVVLPDWQGLGVGGRLDDWLGQHLYEQGFRYRNTIAHPAMIAYYGRSPRWRDVSSNRNQLVTTSRNKALRKRSLDPRYLGTRSCEYAPLPKGGRYEPHVDRREAARGAGDGGVGALPRFGDHR